MLGLGEQARVITFSQIARCDVCAYGRLNLILDLRFVVVQVDRSRVGAGPGTV